ncbi:MULTISPECIES: DUF3885 domain-containing protein [unclassified Shimia]|uniref:DUF3885 domain-containing protein n=1 Tax=unclassified Shimia TaxID=2630038 RepID=UPI0031044A27
MTSELDLFAASFPYLDFPRGLTDDCPYWLTFELGGETYSTRRPMRRFMQAFDRADAVSRNLFVNSKNIWMISASYGGRKHKKRFLKTYNLCGLKRSHFISLGIRRQNENYLNDVTGDLFQHLFAARLQDHDHLKEILWLTLGGDMGIRPIAPGTVYFVDLDNKLALHVYDDRGMNLFSAQKQGLHGIYNDFNPWLLDYDLPEMKAIFEGV